MSSPVNLRAIIGVMDRASAPLRFIARGFGGMDLRARMAMANLNRLGRATGLSQLTTRLGQASRSAMAFAGHLKTIVFNAAAMAGVAGLGGLGGVLRSFSTAGDDIAKLANRTGLGVVAYQEYAFAAKSADIEQQLFDKSLTKLSKNISDAASGKNKSLAELFAKLGIKARNADGSLRSVDDVLPELADGFQRNTNASTRTAMAMALFGEEGVKMIDMLGDGAAALAESREEARKYGILTEEQVAQASALDAGFKGVSFSIRGMAQAIGAKLAPVVLPLLNAFSDWVATNREWIATNIQTAVLGLTDALKGFDWKGFGQSLLSIGRNIKWLVDHTGGWKVALVALLVVLNAGLLLSLGGLVKSLALVGFQMGVVSVRISGMAFAAIGGAVMNFVTALRAGYGAMAALNLVMSANPVGAVILGIAALIAIGVLLWKNWDTVKRAWSSLSDWIMSGVDLLVEKFGPLINILKTVFKYSPVGLAVRAGKALAGAVGGSGQTSPTAGFKGYGSGASAPQLPAAAAQIGRNGGGGQSSRSDVNVAVDFKNVPQGVKTEVRSQGVARTKANVGRAMVQPG